MICFRDMTFCLAECGNTQCHRNFTDELKEKAKAWGGENAPVAFSDFSKDCPYYIPFKVNQTTTEGIKQDE